MIYASHLIADNEMQEIIEQTGMGVESIDFSIADVLDHWEEHLPEYKERFHVMGTGTSYAPWSVSGSESGGV